jgi:hypothetical protein
MVNLKRILGGLMIGFVFLVIFVSMAVSDGIWLALGAFVSVIFIVIFLAIGVFLTSNEGEKLW